MYNQGRFYFKIPIYSLSAAAGCAESWLQVKGVSSSLPCSHLAWVPFKARCSWKIRVLGLGSEYRGAFSPKEGGWSLLVALGTSVEGGGVQRAGMMWWRSRWGWKIGANDGDYWGGFTFISCGQGTKVRCGTCRDEFALTKAIFFFPHYWVWDQNVSFEGTVKTQMLFSWAWLQGGVTSVSFPWDWCAVCTSHTQVLVALVPKLLGNHNWDCFASLPQLSVFFFPFKKNLS